jgi:hypothetical protein
LLAEKRRGAYGRAEEGVDRWYVGVLGGEDKKCRHGGGGTGRGEDERPRPTSHVGFSIFFTPSRRLLHLRKEGGKR